MPFENRWPILRRVPLLPKSVRPGGMTITLIEDNSHDERAWDFRSQQHMVFVFLTEGPRFLDLAVEGVQANDQTPQAGSVWSVPASRQCRARLEGAASQICEISIGTSSDGGLALNLTPVVNAQDLLLHQLVLRIANLADSTGKVEHALLVHLAEAIRWHIVDNYCAQAKSLEQSGNKIGLTTKAQSLLEAHIREHLGDRIMLDDLAELVGVSTHNLLKQFRNSFGTTPAQYIINERVSQAQVLLRGSSLPITEVALVTGFYSPSHFCTVFSKHVGITPSAYRRQS